jgi:putative ABC transport system permease protein
MIAVMVRGLFTRKLRTVLTMVAIILGVSMIAGTYVLTDTINHSFTQIFSESDRRIDAVVLGKQAISSTFRAPPTIPARVLGIVNGTPGVSAAEGEIADTAQLYDLHNKQVGSVGGAPTLLFSSPQPRFRTTTLVQGHEPEGAEITIDESSFKRAHLHLGQVLRVAAVASAERFTLVGVFRFGSIGSIGGATVFSMPLTVAQRITDKRGKYDQIVVAAAPGVSQSEIARRIRARIPTNLRATVKVETSKQNVADQTKAIGDALNFITIGLLAFGGIAVFVGAFIIFNTFSITVAQRTREFGLLRTLGATRRQVLQSVVAEAFAVGLTASILGLIAGLLIAQGLNGLFKALGADLPNAGQVVATRTVVVALLVGTVVTVAASVWPAVRATRVPPIAALREGASLPRSRYARFFPAIAAVLGAAGLAVLMIGIFASITQTSQRLLLIGLGAVLLFLGVAMFSPQLVRPMASALGWPLERLTRITGRLARENAVRNPARTAVTAAALMIGLALVGFVTIFAAELKKSAADTINREIAGTFLVYNQQQSLIPPGIAPALQTVPGVTAVSALNSDSMRFRGIGVQTVTGIQPATFGQVYRFQWTNGSTGALNRMRPHDALISDNFARDHNLRLGSTLPVTTTVSKHDTFRVIGIFKGSQLLGPVCITYATLRRDAALDRDFADIVQAAPDANLTVLKKRINHLLVTRYPSASVNSQQDFKDQQAQSVNQLLTLIYVLLAMSVLVSLFGIINTLVLSVYERTREIGMLRAIGTTRRQVRWMVRWESVITSVIGAILGLLLGIVLAALVTQGLSDQGIEFTLPIGQLLIWVVFAIIFGIVAAAWPARRAARLDVLQAVAYE